MPAPEHPAPVLGTGLAILLGGVALLLQELDLLTLRWSLVLPVILVVVGLVVALAGVAGTARGR